MTIVIPEIEYQASLPLAIKRQKRDRLYEHLILNYYGWIPAFRNDPEPADVLDMIVCQGEFALSYYRSVKHAEFVDPYDKSEFHELFLLSVQIGREEHRLAKSPRHHPHWWNWFPNEY